MGRCVASSCRLLTCRVLTQSPEHSVPPTLLATLITAQHARPFQALPLAFAPVLLFSSYLNLGGYKTDAAGTTAAWSGLYALLAMRRKQVRPYTLVPDLIPGKLQYFDHALSPVAIQEKVHSTGRCPWSLLGALCCKCSWVRASLRIWEEGERGAAVAQPSVMASCPVPYCNFSPLKSAITMAQKNSEYSLFAHRDDGCAM